MYVSKIAAFFSWMQFTSKSVQIIQKKGEEYCMTDLNNLFRQNRKAQPVLSKRLFPSQTEEKQRSRSREPHKDTPRATVPRATLAHTQMAKRYLSKSHLRKELQLYNNQILLVLTRKTFFLMVALLSFHILATHFHQPLLVANLVLAVLLFRLNLDWGFLGSQYCQMLSWLAKIAAVSVNSALLIHQVDKLQFQTHRTAIALVALNTGINYVLIEFFQPVIVLRGIQNIRTPYLGYLQKFWLELQSYFESYKTLYKLSRPIFVFNFIYWLVVLAYIIKIQDNLLFDSIFSYSMLRAALASSIVLHFMVQIVKIIDLKMSIELLSSNKKEINLNLLRLNGQEGNNSSLHWEIQKYIWSSCEVFWDTEFLTHRYQINYDLLEDHILRELQKLENKVKKVNQSIEAIRETTKQELDMKSYSITTSFSDRIDSIREGIWLMQLLFSLQTKKYLFYIVDQISYFQRIGTASPIHMQKIHKSISKLAKNLISLQENTSIQQLRLCLNQLSRYLLDTIQLQKSVQ